MYHSILRFGRPCAAASPLDGQWLGLGSTPGCIWAVPTVGMAGLELWGCVATFIWFWENQGRKFFSLVWQSDIYLLVLPRNVDDNLKNSTFPYLHSRFEPHQQRSRSATTARASGLLLGSKHFTALLWRIQEQQTKDFSTENIVYEKLPDIQSHINWTWKFLPLIVLPCASKDQH